MTIHVARDYPSATTGYFGLSGIFYFFTPFLYNLAIFLNRVLGYSVVGQTGFNINSTNSQTFTYSANTAIAAASSGQILPQSTINVGSTTGFPASGTIYVNTSNGVQIVKYSGTTATTFTNCSGGTGTMTAGITTTTSGIQTLPTATINVTGNPITLGFPTSGTIYVITSAGPQIVNYTNITSSSFTGCTGGTGNTSAGGAVSSSGGAVVCGQNKILTGSGSSSAPWTITTTFPHGMTTGDYTQITSGSTINTSIVPSYQVQVIDPYTLVLLGSVGGAYTINTAAIQPAGMLIASGTALGGTGASINFAGAPSIYAVQIPTSIRTVVSGAAPTQGDVGRLLVLKSSSYPTKNSGIFKISTVNTATNSYTVDYRSSDTPPPESGTLDWAIYEIETQASNYLQLPDFNRSNYAITGATNTTPIQITYNVNTLTGFQTGQKVTISGVLGNTAANGTWTITSTGSNTMLLNASSGNGTYTANTGTVTRTGYTGGQGLSYNSKIILQSPHSAGWQVRLAVEQYNIPSVTPYTSISVGYGGTSTGDWVAGGITTHTGAFLDQNPAAAGPYQYTYTGSADSTNAPRLTIIGDDTGQSVFIYARAQTGGSNGLTTFGIPNNEPSPPPANSNRIFCYGGNTGASPGYGGIQMRGGINANLGLSYRDTNPELCMIAGWANLDGVSGTSPVYSANAGDCPFTGTTEVLPWELWAACSTDPQLNLPFPSGGATVWSLNQRFMGTAPYLRQGRTNFGTFTLSTDSTATSSITAATSASPIQITTSAINALTTGQTVVITGVTGNLAANGTWVITVIDNTHFTLNNSTGSGSYAGGGTVQGTPRWLHLQNGIYLQWNGAGGLTP